MQFVKPIAVIHTAHNLKGGLQLAEFAGRLCYKSESKIEPGSYQKFLLMLIDKGHSSILEHCPIYITGRLGDMDEYSYNIATSHFSKHIIEKSKRNSNDDVFYIYSNLRVVCDVNPYLAKQLVMTSTMEGDEIWKKHGVSWFVPDFNHPFARMSAYITTLRSVVDDLVRERVQSMAVESTRWCDYSNNSKFEGITFCLPHWINHSIFDSCMKRFLADVKEANINKDKIDKLYDYEDIAFCLYQNTEAIEAKRCYHYIRASILDEILYNEAKDELKLPAQDAREYLFLGVKSEMYYTGYNEDWDNIIEKRLYDKYGKAHENMHVIMQKCKDHLDSIRVSQKAAQDDKTSKSTSK
jgi:thymidylate synthase (FAD)